MHQPGSGPQRRIPQPAPLQQERLDQRVPRHHERHERRLQGQEGLGRVQRLGPSDRHPRPERPIVRIWPSHPRVRTSKGTPIRSRVGGSRRATPKSNPNYLCRLACTRFGALGRTGQKT
jgi:hypothetical protein